MSLHPVWVALSSSAVSILILARTRDGIAVVDGNAYMTIGDVRQVTLKGKDGMGFRTIWAWKDIVGSRGESTTKAKAIIDLLESSGFEQVPITATIPDMLVGI